MSENPWKIKVSPYRKDVSNRNALVWPVETVARTSPRRKSQTFTFSPAIPIYTCLSIRFRIMLWILEPRSCLYRCLISATPFLHKSLFLSFSASIKAKDVADSHKKGTANIRNKKAPANSNAPVTTRHASAASAKTSFPASTRHRSRWAGRGRDGGLTKA